MISKMLKKLFNRKDVYIVYPNDYYQSVKIKFKRKLSESEMDQVKNIVSYWGNISYVGEVLSINFVNSSYLNVDVDGTKTTSDDMYQRKPLELLNEFITNGTPIRKTKNNTRAYEGLGKVVYNIIAFR